VPARSAVLPFLLILLSLDAAVVVALGRGVDRTERAARAGAAAPVEVDPGSLDPGWALCQTRFEGKTVTPVSVAVTYLDPGIDDEVVPDEVRSWFEPVDGAQVDVYKLELQGGRRRIALELSQGKWPTWHKVAAGHTGTTVCGLVRAALLSADIGRPLPEHLSPHTAPPASGDPRQGAALDEPDPAYQGEALERSRHDFEFIYARRPRLYRTVEWVGTLDHALELDTFFELRQWLNRRKA
jgi:hypothetical protein